MGDNGPVADNPKAEVDDLSLYIDMRHPIVQNHSQTMKDAKIPAWAEKQSFESWLQDFKLWQSNVGYYEPHYVDQLMVMLKDSNTRKDVVLFMVEDLLERRRASCDKT